MIGVRKYEVLGVHGPRLLDVKVSRLEKAQQIAHLNGPHVRSGVRVRLEVEVGERVRTCIGW